MRIIAVDDKPAPRRALKKAIEEASPESEVQVFSNAEEVLALDDLHAFDAAFVDIDMPGIDGIELARRLKAINPRMNIIFATGYGEYMAEAFALHSSGYLTKPITSQKVAAELENLRYPIDQALDDNGLFVHCFGRFEVFSGGKPVVFSRARTKELFAFLVDCKGALCTMGDIEAVIWEDDSGISSVSSYLRTLVADMRSTLAEAGHPDVVIKRRGVVGLATELFSCDYYDFLKGVPASINAFNGEYMSQYSWAESTLGGIASSYSRFGD